MFELMLGAGARPYKPVEYPHSGPGPKLLVAGTPECGYFGEVSSEELMTYQAYKDHLGASTVTPHDLGDLGWFKFYWKNKVIYYSKAPLSQTGPKADIETVSWTDVYNLGGVYGVDGNGPFNGGTGVNQYKPAVVEDDTFAWKLIPRVPNTGVKGADPSPTIPPYTGNENWGARGTEFIETLGRITTDIHAPSDIVGKWGKYKAPEIGTNISNLGSATRASELTRIIAFGAVNGANLAQANYPTRSSKSVAWRAVLELEGYSMPLKDEWSSLPDLTLDATQGHSVTVVGNKAYIYGGTYSGTTSMRALNLDTGEVTTLASAQIKSTRHAGVAVGTKIYYFGGYSDTSANTPRLNEMRVYDTVNNSWANLAVGPERREAGVAWAVGDIIYIGGGSKATGKEVPVVTESLLAYNISSNTWSVASTVGWTLNEGSSARVGDSFYSFGGYTVAKTTQFAVTEAATPLVRNLLPGIANDRYEHTMGYGKNGIYLFGGMTGTTSSSNTVQRYDIATQQWTTLNPMPIPVGGRSKAVSYNNKIYLIGGNGTAAKKVQVYTP